MVLLLKEGRGGQLQLEWAGSGRAADQKCAPLVAVAVGQF